MSLEPVSEHMHKESFTLFRWRNIEIGGDSAFAPPSMRSFRHTA
ncbi:hypothetical protein CRG98_048654, partial [Punica granatum]